MTTETAKHTPAPWQASGVLRGGEPTIIIGDVFGTELARVYVGTDSMAEDEANARLLAAAPELLEALQGVVMLIESGTLTLREGIAAGAHDRAVGIGIKADAAIAKATGQ